MDVPQGPALDPATIGELHRLQAEYAKPAFIRELVAIFKANAPGRMHAIREAIQQSDRGGLEHVAHTLKSNCGMLGALRMAALCAELEAAGEQGGFDRAAALLPEAEGEFARVLAAVDELSRQES
ncbi:MAG: Hpt domain-containing protein [Acidobacteriota bacterium]